MIVKYEGIVEDVYESAFTAELYPMIGDDSEKWAEIYLSSVPERDRHMVVPGAVFYWRICEKKGSTIHFRRFVPKLPGLDEVRASGARLSLALGWS